MLKAQNIKEIMISTPLVSVTTHSDTTRKLQYQEVNRKDGRFNWVTYLCARTKLPQVLAGSPQLPPTELDR